MNQEEIRHLAKLARIELSDEEVEHFTNEMSAILNYVSQIKDIVGEVDVLEKKTGAVFNVFRKDEIKNQPDQFTEDIINEMPRKDGRFMVVKKILNTEG